MTTPICEDNGLLQEWAPEYTLLSQIPQKAQRGIFSHDLNLTCIDVCPEFLSLGTNCGLVYWYCRASAQLERLRLENTNCSVTSVKIVSTVDFMVAAGTDIGNITVFQIPKDHPDSLPDALRPKKKQVERFTIDGLHKKPVSCLEWSQNGMKLFSGDKSGTVVLTMIDFYMHLSKSTEILNEQFEIVQLSYLQNQLLISSTYRTIICDGSENWKVIQLGSKERKILGAFGATFCKFGHGAVIYASRPGQRLWLADKSGKVEQTLIFKAAIQAAHPSIPILNPTQQQRLASNQHFGKLIQFGEDRLICYQSEVLFLLHPGAISVGASILNVRKIIDVAVNNDEIYILEGDRSLIRIGHEPNAFAIDEIVETSERRKSFNLDSLANKIKVTALGSLKRIAADLSVPTDLPLPVLADEALDLPPVDNAAQHISPPSLPEPNVEIHESIECEQPSCSYKEPKSVATCTKGFPEEEILYRPIRKRKQKKFNQFQPQGVGQESETDTISTASEDRLVLGVANDCSISEESPTSWSQSYSSFSVLKDLQLFAPLSASLQADTSKNLDDLDTCDSASENLVLTPNLFREEQTKTFKRLANQDATLLDSFNSTRTENMSISVNLTPSSSASSKLSEMASSDTSENVSMVSETDPRVEACTSSAEPADNQISTSCAASSLSGRSSPKDSTSARQWNKEMILSQMLGIDLQDPLNKLSKIETKADEANSNDNEIEAASISKTLEPDEINRLLPESDQEMARMCNENEANDNSLSTMASLEGLGYGPPSGSSMLTSCHPSLDLNCGLAVLNNPQALVVEKSDRWLQYKTPDGLKVLTVCNNYVMCIDTVGRVFYSKLSGISLNWALLDYSATNASVSPDGRIVWIQGPQSVTALVNPSRNGPFSEQSAEVDISPILSFSVDVDCAYFVKYDGKLMCQNNLVRLPCGKSENVPCFWPLKYILCHKGVVFGITNSNELICKTTANGSFTKVKTPSGTVTSIAAGPLNMVWVVDSDNKIYFSDDFDNTDPNWWQVLISEYIFQNTQSTFLNMHNRVKMGAKWEVGRSGAKKSTHISANESSVWIYNKLSSSVNVNKSDFTGVKWQDITFKFRLKFTFISVDGVFEEKGHVWMLSAQGDLFCTTPNAIEKITPVEGPCGNEVVCLGAAPDTLWVLTADGRIHARLGLSASCLTGSSWRQLQLPQLADKRFVWVSCGCDVAWCVDVTGRVFISPLPPYNMATNPMDAGWLEVDGQPKDSSNFVKVFVGPHMHMVWALDNKKQIYVREGIFPNHPIGTGWVHVGGIEAVQLTVSSTAVWAVSARHELFRRHGISESNYIGDYWRKVSGSTVAVSATFDDSLWGITPTGSITQMLLRKISLAKPEDNRCVSIGDDDWLVVE